jgi:hypothetical protein
MGCAAVPDGLELHLVCDNDAHHKTEAVPKWLLRHRRFCPHFTPTSASWVNLMERRCAELTKTADEILDTLAAYC